MSEFPEDLWYTPEGLWVSIEGNIATVGISDWLQDKMGGLLQIDYNEHNDTIIEVQDDGHPTPPACHLPVPLPYSAGFCNGTRTVDFMLSHRRNAKAARRFLVKALRTRQDWPPHVINTDKNPASARRCGN